MNNHESPHIDLAESPDLPSGVPYQLQLLKRRVAEEGEEIEALKDDVKTIKGDIGGIKEDISCFRGKFEVMFTYFMPKKYHNFENPDKEKARITKEKTYDTAIKVLIASVLFLITMLGVSSL